jgi:HEAT repeat protein
MQTLLRTGFLMILACLAVSAAGRQLAAADEPTKQPDFRALIEQFAGGKGVDRFRVVEQIAARGDKVVSELIRRLDDPNRDIAYGCRDSLSHVGAAAVPSLVKALSAKSPRVRQLAASAFFGMQADRSAAVPALIAALNDPNDRVRAEAILALSHIRDRRSLGPLTLVLLDPDENVRFSAVAAFGNFGADGRVALPTLFLMLRDIPADQLARSELALQIRNALVAIGEPAVPTIGYELRRPGANRELKHALVTALDFAAQEDDGRRVITAVPFLAELLQRKEDADLKGLAASTLAYMGPRASAAVPALQAALGDRDGYVRMEAAGALCAVDPPARKRYIAVLAGGLSDKDHNTRYCAARELGDFPADAVVAVSALTAALKDKDDDVRLMTCNTLRAIGHPAAQALPALKEISSNDTSESVRSAAAQAVSAIQK